MPILSSVEFLNEMESDMQVSAYFVLHLCHLYSNRKTNHSLNDLRNTVLSNTIKKLVAHHA